ncbi:MAG: hypothetical protein ACTSUK_01180 [Promethearchaeota archaeon]
MEVITQEEKSIIKKVVESIDSEDLLSFRTIRELLMMRITDPYLKSPFLLNRTCRLAGSYFVKIHGIPYREKRSKVIKDYILSNPNMNRKELASVCRITISTVNNILSKAGAIPSIPRSISNTKAIKELKKKVRLAKTQLCANVKIKKNKKISSYKRKDFHKVELISCGGEVVGEIEILPEFSFGLEYADKKELLYPNSLTPDEKTVLTSKIVEVNLLLGKVLDSILKGEYNERR